jgi:hypothetical protein
LDLYLSQASPLPLRERVIVCEELLPWASLLPSPSFVSSSPATAWSKHGKKVHVVKVGRLEKEEVVGAIATVGE